MAAKKPAKKLRPTREAAINSFVATFIVVAVIAVLGMMDFKTLQLRPAEQLYYAPRWSEHGYGTSCNACHTQAFRAAPDAACYVCHMDYAPGYDLSLVEVYPADWQPDPTRWDAERRARNKHAHLVYHNMDQLRGIHSALEKLEAPVDEI